MFNRRRNSLRRYSTFNGAGNKRASDAGVRRSSIGLARRDSGIEGSLGPSSNAESISVMVRCRGRNRREIDAKAAVIVDVPEVTGGKQVTVTLSDDLSISGQLTSSRTYTVDQVFGPGTDQATFYQGVAEPLCEEFCKGFNCTIFAYGQTGAGKTYTMCGRGSQDAQDSSDQGIIPRVLHDLFNKHVVGPDTILRCSFVEIYNEELKDLLSSQKGVSRLKIYEQKRKGANGNGAIRIDGLEEYQIRSYKDGLKLLNEGIKNRVTAATKLNDLSSRSHTIFTLSMISRESSKQDGEFRHAKLNLVDLAGSENISRSGSMTVRAKEAGSINQSLLTLGRVINALVDGSSYVPYRESKLTRLLQDSLGGNTKTVLIANVAPTSVDYQPTLSTLEYASKAKNIKNAVQIGPLVSDETLMRELIDENHRLKLDLKATRRREGVYLDEDNYEALIRDYNNVKSEVKEMRRVADTLQVQLEVQNKKIEMQLKQKEECVASLHQLETRLVESANRINEQQRVQGEVSSRLQDLANGTLSEVCATQKSIVECAQRQLEETLQPLEAKLERLLGSSSDVDQKSFTEEGDRVANVVSLVRTRLKELTLNQKQLMEGALLSEGALHDLGKRLEEVSEEVGKEVQQSQQIIEESGEANDRLYEYVTRGAFDGNDEQLAETVLSLSDERIKKFQKEMSLRMHELCSDLALKNTASIKRILRSKIEKEAGEWHKRVEANTERLQTSHGCIVGKVGSLASRGSNVLESAVGTFSSQHEFGEAAVEVLQDTESKHLPGIASSMAAVTSSGIELAGKNATMGSHLQECATAIDKFSSDFKENVVAKSNESKLQHVAMSREIGSMVHDMGGKRVLGEAGAKQPGGRSKRVKIETP